MVKAQRLPDGTFHVMADEVHERTYGCIGLPPECRSLFDKIQHQSGYDINPKTVPVGSVLYYTENGKVIPCRRVVRWGLVVEHYVDCIVVEKLERADRRRVDGVPVKEFLEDCPTPWKKLPKGWDWETELFHVTEDPGGPSPDIRDPSAILEAVENGTLVPAKDNFHVDFQSEFDRHQGWRIVPKWRDYITMDTVDFHNAFETYADAQAACDEINHEYERQASLSDYDWSVEKIDEALKECYSLTEDERAKYRAWLLERPNVEDIQTRAYCGKIQWKYIKNKTWKDIIL